jgi:hypothetical protein
MMPKKIDKLHSGRGEFRRNFQIEMHELLYKKFSNYAKENEKTMKEIFISLLYQLVEMTEEEFKEEAMNFESIADEKTSQVA